MRPSWIFHGFGRFMSIGDDSTVFSTQYSTPWYLTQLLTFTPFALSQEITMECNQWNKIGENTVVRICHLIITFFPFRCTVLNDVCHQDFYSNSPLRPCLDTFGCFPVSAKRSIQTSPYACSFNVFWKMNFYPHISRWYSVDDSHFSPYGLVDYQSYG